MPRRTVRFAVLALPAGSVAVIWIVFDPVPSGTTTVNAPLPSARALTVPFVAAFRALTVLRACVWPLIVDRLPVDHGVRLRRAHGDPRLARVQDVGHGGGRLGLEVRRPDDRRGERVRAGAERDVRNDESLRLADRDLGDDAGIAVADRDVDPDQRTGVAGDARRHGSLEVDGRLVRIRLVRHLEHRGIGRDRIGAPTGPAWR